MRQCVQNCGAVDRIRRSAGWGPSSLLSFSCDTHTIASASRSSSLPPSSGCCAFPSIPVPSLLPTPHTWTLRYACFHFHRVPSVRAQHAARTTLETSRSFLACTCSRAPLAIRPSTGLLRRPRGRNEHVVVIVSQGPPATSTQSIIAPCFLRTSVESLSTVTRSPCSQSQHSKWNDVTEQLIKPNLLPF